MNWEFNINSIFQCSIGILLYVNLNKNSSISFLFDEAIVLDIISSITNISIMKAVCIIISLYK